MKNKEFDIENTQIDDFVDGQTEQEAELQKQRDEMEKKFFESELAMILKHYEANIKSGIPLMLRPVTNAINLLLVTLAEQGIIPVHGLDNTPVKRVTTKFYMGKLMLIPA
jgi:hypothetical protein